MVLSKLTAISKTNTIYIIGLLVMFIPVFRDMAVNLWVKNIQSQGPIVLGIILFLFFSKRHHLLRNYNYSNSKTSNFIAYTLFVIGNLIYVVGRMQDVFFLQVVSLIPIIFSILLINFGMSITAKFAFPIFFIFFLLPLPSFVIDSITLPMKVAVSTVTEKVLYSLDYPIARDGVILQIGQYKLLVADACAGLQTLLSLEAIGLLYLYLLKHESIVRNFVMGLLIIPISFIANVIRVITLTLITYYFGSEVGEGFIHGFAGVFLFIIALCMLIIIDTIVLKLIEK